MTSPLAALQPASLWGHFDQIRSIPRPSGHEEKILAHIERWAAERKLASRRDAVGNLVVKVPATPGHEGARTVILQGHVDMVAEKDKATEFDFLTQPIPVVVDGDWVVARSTTLGADNGVGVAAALASVDDPAVVHGPLELLFTIDEETGLTGASNLDGSLLDGRTLLNLDSEEDGALFVGCAGGCTSEIELPLRRAPAPAGHVAVRVEVTGLKGGHSGLCIHENRGNSLQVVAQVLRRWLAAVPVFLESIEGGNKHNAIPREAVAVVHVPAGFVADARGIADDVRCEFHTELEAIDPELRVMVRNAASTVAPADLESTTRLVRLLVAVPNGVVSMSRDIPGLTETSTNLAIARTEGDVVKIVSSSRSSVEPARDHVRDQIEAIVLLAGGRHTTVGAYPGWQPNMASPLLASCRAVYRELRGAEPKVTAIHAGLECGIIGEHLGGGVDMISYGPQLEGVHAPGEKANIPSVARFWEFHKALLRSLA